MENKNLVFYAARLGAESTINDDWHCGSRRDRMS